MTEYIVNADEENSLMYGRKYEELIRCKDYRMTNEEIYGEVYNEGYQKGLDDAWELARKLLFIEAEGGMSMADIKECFGSEYDIARSLHMDVADTKAKYDAWKKKKDAVRVGDLIHTKRSDRDMVVTGIAGSTPMYHAVDIKYGTGTLLLRHEFVTTGKHYDLPWVKNGTD